MGRNRTGAEARRCEPRASCPLQVVLARNDTAGLSNIIAQVLGIPVLTNAQIFGRLSSATGVHGTHYPSMRNSSHQCLELYP